MIFINRSFNVENIVTSVGDEHEEFPEEPKQEIAQAMTKIDVLLSICKGTCNITSCGVDTTDRETYNASVMNGVTVLPPPSNQKIIIFASYEESLNTICDVLRQNDIAFQKLGGQTSSINRQVEAFRTDTKVLLVNSSVRSAGLNLEFATDVIFYHKIIDQKKATQVICRAQRIGRTSNLRVHNLRYQDELLATA
jgi:SNF2 family DNA or RNA helicase